MNILITMTADNAEDLEWRECEMRKLLISQDLNIVSCSFREEQGFLSSLPLINLEKHLYERSKRNVLTSGAATEIGEADCTRISVMAKEDFPKWLNEREKSLKTISDF